MDNEIIVANKINELFSPSEMETLIKFAELEARVKVIKDEKRQAIIDIFKAYSVKNFRNEKLSITYIGPTTKKIVDTKKMKEEGIYELYTKETDVKENVRIMMNYED